MKLLNKKQQQELVELISANQLIMNNYDTLEGFDKFSAYSQFCDNSAKLIREIGGNDALIEVSQYIFFRNSERIKND